VPNGAPVQKKQFQVLHFGKFNQQGAKRTSEWLTKHVDDNDELIFSFHVNGPDHLFGPGAPMITITDPLNDIEIVTDNHFLSESLRTTIYTIKKNLPFVKTKNDGTLVKPTAVPQDHQDYSSKALTRSKLRRLDVLEERAGILFLHHKFQTKRQQQSYDENVRTLCDFKGVVSITQDFKRDIGLCQTPWQTKKMYYKQPTAAYYGMAIQYCETQGDPTSLKTLYIDVTSTAHKKDGPWVASAMEVIFGFASAKKHDDPTFDRARESTTSTVHGGWDVLQKAQQVLKDATFIHFWSDNGGK